MIIRHAGGELWVVATADTNEALTVPLSHQEALDWLAMFRAVVELF